MTRDVSSYPDRFCSVSDCEKEHYCRGWCTTHYQRWRKRGTVELPAVPTLEERFLANLDQSGDCWVWTAGRFITGYGAFWFDGQMRYAHRVAWELFVGPIPPGKQVLHHCDNPPCCNPGDLFIGTPADNVLDMMSKQRQNFSGLLYFDLGRQLDEAIER